MNKKTLLNRLTMTAELRNTTKMDIVKDTFDYYAREQADNYANQFPDRMKIYDEIINFYEEFIVQDNLGRMENER